MASSDHQRTETTSPETDEKWVFLQDGGDKVTDQLFEQQDGDTKGAKQSVPPEPSTHDMEKFLQWCRFGTDDVSGLMENIRDAAKRLETTRDPENFFWWCRTAWNDAFVRSALWGDKRLHIICAALFVHTVLHVLAALASLTESNALHALLICLKHFTMATLKAAVLSIVTRFFSLVAVKASVLVSSRNVGVLLLLTTTNSGILLPACLVCCHEVGAGITVFQEARREENFAWFLQMLADMARVYGLTAATVACASLAFFMCNDLKVAMRAFMLNCHIIMEHRKVSPSEKEGVEEGVQQKPLPDQLSRAIGVAPAATSGI